MDPNWFSSVAGVALAAVALAQLVKKTAAEVSGLNVLPVWLYVMLFAGLGTWFAHSYLGTLSEEGASLSLLITKAITTGLIAIGAFETVTNLVKPLSASGSSEPRGAFGQKKFLLALVLIPTLAIGGVACATSNKARVVAGYQSAQAALGTFQDVERQLYAMQNVPGLTKEVHGNILRALIRAYDVQEKFGDALLIWRSGEAPIGTEAWLNEVSRVITEIEKLAPESEARLRLAREALAWVRTVLDIARRLGVQPPANVDAFAKAGVTG